MSLASSTMATMMRASEDAARVVRKRSGPVFFRARRFSKSIARPQKIDDGTTMLKHLTMQTVSGSVLMMNFAAQLATTCFLVSHGELVHRTNDHQRSSRRLLHAKISRQNNGSADHYISARTQRRVRNPQTKRMIQIKDLNTTSTWRDLVWKEGGYVAHGGELVTIDRRCLVQWQHARNFDDSAADYTQHSSLKTWVDTWFPIDDIQLDCSSDSPKDPLINQLPKLNELLFVHKPTRMLTLPGIDQEDCLANQVIDWLRSSPEGRHRLRKSKLTSKSQTTSKKQRKQQVDFVPRPCHRLDYDTSGVVVIALTRDALQKASKQFEDRVTEKIYVGLVAGHVQLDAGTVDIPIGKVKSDKGHNEFTYLGSHRGKSPSDFVDGSLRDALTDYKVSKRFSLPFGDSSMATFTRIELNPRTGRGHQLRLHMEALEHPMLGDELHGLASAAPRLCLHAEKLQLKVAIENKCCVVAAVSLAPF
jgi:tRNA pseudouridine32 synthase/23S rRNA pseudouridine746 synthase